MLKTKNRHESTMPVAASIVIRMNKLAEMTRGSTRSVTESGGGPLSAT